MVMGSSSGERVAAAAVWYLRGARHLISIPALVLLASVAGFSALARDAGLSLGETVLITLGVWALPSQIVYIGMVGSGASLAAVMLAVSLSGARFLPMVMAWTPVVRGPGTPRALVLALSWFVAVTSWVFAMARLPGLPQAARLPFFAGFATGLAASSVLVIAVAHTLLGDVPGVVAAGLVFLTPVYFLLAMWGAARIAADRIALGAGLVLGPLFAVLVPEADILIAGVLGGTLAYGVHRARRRRA
jgi:predicted branched-subunit amino acid permease